MMKKALTLLAVMCIAMTATACVHRSNQQYYERAQLYLGSGDAEYAAELFAQLGEYRDSAEYALYADGITALEAGDLDLARTNMETIDPFKSSGRYLIYITALEAELADELDKALSLYEQLGTFHCAHEAAEELRTAIPEAAMREGRALMSKGEYAAARELFLSLNGYGQSAALAENCTAALNRAAYTAADKLCEAGDHLAAMQAFLAMGDVLDAPARAERCRDALHDALSQQAESATLETAGAIIDACNALGDEDSAQLAAALTARYGVNMDVLSKAADQPFVLLGQYPTGESGVESALMWQVIAANGPEVTLLCTTVIDASPIATPTDLAFPEDAQPAVTGLSLPSAADLATLGSLASPATPYAVAQGVTQQDGSALYWLRDSLENGVHPVVSGSGLTIPQNGVTPGVRPVITLSLEDYVFTAGDGTMENPFR